jgi:hypothetical protein
MIDLAAPLRRHRVGHIFERLQLVCSLDARAQMLEQPELQESVDPETEGELIMLHCTDAGWQRCFAVACKSTPLHG